MPSQNLLSFFDKMPDPRQIMDNQDGTNKTETGLCRLSHDKSASKEKGFDQKLFVQDLIIESPLVKTKSL